VGHKGREAIGNRARQVVLTKFRVEAFAAKALAFLKINQALCTAG
jgi:hypothetical protein